MALNVNQIQFGENKYLGTYNQGILYSKVDDLQLRNLASIEISLKSRCLQKNIFRSKKRRKRHLRVQMVHLPINMGLQQCNMSFITDQIFLIKKPHLTNETGRG